MMKPVGNYAAVRSIAHNQRRMKKAWCESRSTGYELTLIPKRLSAIRERCCRSRGRAGISYAPLATLADRRASSPRGIVDAPGAHGRFALKKREARVKIFGIKAQGGIQSRNISCQGARRSREVLRGGSALDSRFGYGTCQTLFRRTRSSQCFV